MMHVDFAVSIALMIGIISFSLFYTVGYYNNNLDSIRGQSLDEYTGAAARDIFSAGGKSTSYINRISVSAEETGGYGHDEEILITIDASSIRGIAVYDREMNLIEDAYSGKSISFDASFGPGERKIFYVTYSGTESSHISYSTGTDLEIRIVSERSISVVSEEKCSTIDTDGFERNIAISLDSCVVGSAPPEKTDVLVRRIPVLYKRSNDIIVPAYATLKVW